jgi:hypothetical protein
MGAPKNATAERGAITSSRPLLAATPAIVRNASEFGLSAAAPARLSAGGYAAMHRHQRQRSSVT